MKNIWLVADKPGYLGVKSEEMRNLWNKKYGKDNWEISWVTANGKELTYKDVFDIYVEGYVKYFRNHPDEAKHLTDNYAYGYDIDLIPKKEAFDMYYLYDKPNTRNQFHNVALNIALEQKLNLTFKGKSPIQIRGGKPGTPTSTWPEGWKWHPGLIPCPYPQLIPQNVTHENKWWNTNSIEDLYQSAKVLKVKK